MGKVRTVLGDIEASELGYTLPHEHVFMDVAGHGHPDIEWSLWRWDEQLDMVKEFKKHEGGCLVDANPTSADGRDVARLYTVSKQTGVHILACTGIVKEQIKDGKSNVANLEGKTVEELTDIFVKEIEEGIDGTDIKAGWIKGASMYHYITPLQEKCLRAGARASMITGVPIHTHTEVGTYALEQVEIVKSEGMDLTRFGVAHMDRNPDYWLHKKILEQGCYMIYDGPGKAKYGPDSMRVDLLRRLCADGFGDRLMLCNDMGKKSHHPQYGGGPGWNWIHDKFLPRLIDEGFDPAQVHRFNYENPQAFYTLREKHPR